MDFKSAASKGRDIANTLRQANPIVGEDLTEQQQLLIYVTSLEQELLRNSPYRIGRHWPGKRSIHGLDLVIILRRALAVTKHLAGSKRDHSDELMMDISLLHQSLDDANVYIVHEEAQT